MKSHHWRIERMSSIDRNVLRLATYELYFQTETPVKVVINEAIEIAKKYGSADSSKFINGILDQIAICLNRKPVKTEFKKGR
jgi:N utilization substance protein B